MKIFKKFIKKKDLIAENADLKRQLSLEKLKSAYWIIKSKGEEPNLICSKETMEYITKTDSYVSKMKT